MQHVDRFRAGVEPTVIVCLCRKHLRTLCSNFRSNFSLIANKFIKNPLYRVILLEIELKLCI